MKHQYIVQGIVGSGSGKGKTVYVTSVGDWWAWGSRHNAVKFDKFATAMNAGHSTKGPVFRAPRPDSITVLEVE